MRYSADFADCPRCGPADEEVKPIEVGQRRPKLSQPKPRKVRSFFMPWEGPDEDED